jgi:hypothetical protein
MIRSGQIFSMKFFISNATVQPTTSFSSALTIISRLILGVWMLSMIGVANAVEQDSSLYETGRRIYEDGVLPGGEPLQAVRPEGFMMEGKYAACVSCHRRSGMGSIEGNIDTTILVPPVAGPVLFAPSRFANSELDTSHHYVPNDAWERVLTRSAYDGQSFARSLREGMDPDSKRLVAPMPLYNLDDAALTALSAYLKQLTSKPAPGIEPDVLHLATVITPGVRPDHAEAVLGVLRSWADSARGAGMPWRLQVWQLTGQATTWMAQLEKLYRQQPVFAMLSGAGGAEWAPVHSFCEQYRLPCVLPSLEVMPNEGENDWYSMYFSPGVDLEAQILTHYLNEKRTLQDKGRKIIQLYSSASGRYAAMTLRSNMSSNDMSTIIRKFRVTSPRAAVNGVTANDIMVLWLRPDEITQLAAELPEGPVAGQIFISALLSTPQEISLPKTWKQQVQFVSLFDDVGLQGEIARLRLERWLEQNNLADNTNRRLQADAYAASYLFNDALGEIRGQEIRRPTVPLSREHLLEMLENLVNKYNDSTGLVTTDSHIAYYGRMSLGPRQRVAVRGGTIMRYASTDSNKLSPVSKRIVPLGQ